MRWSFWDDIYYPGLIRNEYELATHALTEKELGKFSVAKRLADQLFRGKPNKAAIAEVEDYRRQLSTYLLRQANEFRASSWIINLWEAGSARDGLEGIELLRAYIGILDYWGYPCAQKEAVDTAGNRTMAIISLRSPTLTLIGRHFERAYHNVRTPRGEAWLHHCIHRDDVLRIEGIPSNFTAELRGARWKFDRSKKDVDVTNATPAQKACTPR